MSTTLTLTEKAEVLVRAGLAADAEEAAGGSTEPWVPAPLGRRHGFGRATARDHQ